MSVQSDETMVDDAEPEQELVVVYRTSSDSEVQAILAMLRSAGLSPTTLGPASLDPTLRYVSGESVTIPIAVPRSEGDEAARLIRDREATEVPAIAEATRLFRTHVLTAAVIGLLAMPLGWWGDGLVGAIFMFAVGFAAAFAVLTVLRVFKLPPSDQPDDEPEDFPDKPPGN
ncbi:MAG: hypothetical protein PHU85_11770 [Phycisphaerae bacterium]|nr:hypothetical protein [Phycisphaerae bacterium]